MGRKNEEGRDYIVTLTHQESSPYYEATTNQGRKMKFAIRDLTSPTRFQNIYLEATNQFPSYIGKGRKQFTNYIENLLSKCETIPIQKESSKSDTIFIAAGEIMSGLKNRLAEKRSQYESLGFPVLKEEDGEEYLYFYFPPLHRIIQNEKINVRDYQLRRILKTNGIKAKAIDVFGKTMRGWGIKKSRLD